MSAANFQACLDVVLKSDGGFVVDQGGATQLGVTQRTLSAWRGRAATVGEVRALTPAAVSPLYRQMYWNPVHGDTLPPGIDLQIFDESINEGPGRAIRHLQQAVGAVADGMFGPGTAQAVAGCDVPETINRIHDTNSAYYDSLASIYPEDERGWHARNDRTFAIALTMAGAMPGATT